MILIQSGAERSVVRSCCCAELVLIEIRVVEIVVVEVLLLSPDAPGSVSQASEKQSATNTTDHTTNCLFGCVTESRTATAAATTVGQRSRIDASGERNDTATGTRNVDGATGADACNCGSHRFGGTGCDESLGRSHRAANGRYRW